MLYALVYFTAATTGISLGNEPDAKPWKKFLRWKAKYDGQDPERAKAVLLAAAQAKIASESKAEVI